MNIMTAEQNTAHMNRRFYQRVATDIQSQVSCLGRQDIATILNVSKNGMCIASRRGYSMNSELNLSITVPGTVLKLSARVSRPVQDSDQGKVVGVEVLDAPPEYIYFVDYLAYLQFVL